MQATTYMNVGTLPPSNLGGAGGGADAQRVTSEGMHIGAQGLQGGYVNTGMGVVHPSHVAMIPQWGYPPPTTDDQPVYVNAKQYHRILKRREARKKKYGDEEVHAGRNRRKQYIHESRHRHAMNRQRGAGGRFLSQKKRAEEEAKKLAAAGGK